MNPDHPADHLSTAEQDEIFLQWQRVLEQRERPTSPSEPPLSFFGATPCTSNS